MPRELLDTLENAGPSSTEGKKCGSHFSNCLQAQVSNSFWLLLRCLCQATSQRYASETFQHLLKPDVLLRAVFLKTPEPWKLVHSSLVCCAKGMAVERYSSKHNASYYAAATATAPTTYSTYCCLDTAMTLLLLLTTGARRRLLLLLLLLWLKVFVSMLLLTVASLVLVLESKTLYSH